MSCHHTRIYGDTSPCPECHPSPDSPHKVSEVVVREVEAHKYFMSLNAPTFANFSENDLTDAWIDGHRNASNQWEGTASRLFSERNRAEAERDSLQAKLSRAEAERDNAVTIIEEAERQGLRDGMNERNKLRTDLAESLLLEARAKAFEEAAKRVSVIVDDLEEAKILIGDFLSEAAAARSVVEKGDGK